jgi:hypothetical protein
MPVDLQRPFNIDAYAMALTSAGLTPSDATVLARYSSDRYFGAKALRSRPIAEQLPAVKPSDGRQVLLDDLVLWQARGPLEGGTRDVFVTLFVGGCPLDHLWPLFVHCLLDEEADPQDHVIVSTEVALSRANEYVALGFPRSGGNWVGFGCGKMVAAASAQAKALLDIDPTPRVLIIPKLRAIRAAMSRAAVKRIDDAILLPASVGRFLDQQQDDIDIALGADLISPWLTAVTHAIGSGELVLDVVRDRFVLPAERTPQPEGWPAERRQPPLAPPRELTNQVLALIHDLKPAESIEALMVSKLSSDPLVWLGGFCDVSMDGAH